MTVHLANWKPVASKKVQIFHVWHLAPQNDQIWLEQPVLKGNYHFLNAAVNIKHCVIVLNYLAIGVHIRANLLQVKKSLLQ